MSLEVEELTSITNKYFLLDGGKAVDIFFDTSFLLNWFLKQHKGIWERPNGGEDIVIPLEYDGQESGFYVKGDTISSDDRESLTRARFEWKHVFGNATVFRIDGLKNAGQYAKVQLVQQRVGGAQKSTTKTLAGSIYDEPGGATERLTGIMACCHETTTTAYGAIQEADLVSEDGTTPWEGKRDTKTEGITLDVLRNLVSGAKIRDGMRGKPDLLVTTETLYNVIVSILQVQQRFVKADERTAKASFTGVEFEGKAFFPDDYMPSGTLIGINSNFMGFAVHAKGNMVRSKWEKIPNSAEDKAMKIYFDGNLVVSNRKAHKAHTNLS